MDVMKIGDRSYNVIGQVQVKDTEITLPLVDIPMMSDERWNELARENAVKNYRREIGREPESVDQAMAWQRQWIADMEV